MRVSVPPTAREYSVSLGGFLVATLNDRDPSSHSASLRMFENTVTVFCSYFGNDGCSLFLIDFPLKKA
jgi:hypothetical protein